MDDPVNFSKSISLAIGDEDSLVDGKGRTTQTVATENSENSAQKVFDETPQRKNNVMKVEKGSATRWADLHKQNRDLSLGLKLEDIQTEGEVIEYGEEEAENIDDAWGLCVIGFFS